MPVQKKQRRKPWTGELGRARAPCFRLWKVVVSPAITDRLSLDSAEWHDINSDGRGMGEDPELVGESARAEEVVEASRDGRNTVHQRTKVRRPEEACNVVTASEPHVACHPGKNP